MGAISRREFIRTTVAAGVSVVLSGCASGSRRAGGAGRPNIVYIVADDLGYGDLGCYGQKDILTPNLDSMAREGMLFTQHYSGSTVCAPSRSCLMTGLHTGHTPIRGNKEHQPEGQHPLPADVVTVAEVLKKAGYATGAFGKWGLGYPGSEGDPNNQGFDEFYGYNCQRYAHNYYPYFLRLFPLSPLINSPHLTPQRFRRNLSIRVGRKVLQGSRIGNSRQAYPAQYDRKGWFFEKILWSELPSGKWKTSVHTVFAPVDRRTAGKPKLRHT